MSVPALRTHPPGNGTSAISRSPRCVPVVGPDDIARAAVFLASDDSAWLTGERLTVSGGYR
jgi:NAD(P)-dependent dehydrogenase (short-subunit alcohol dehydrogenase family)